MNLSASNRAKNSFEVNLHGRQKGIILENPVQIAIQKIAARGNLNLKSLRFHFHFQSLMIKGRLIGDEGTINRGLLKLFQ